MVYFFIPILKEIIFLNPTVERICTPLPSFATFFNWQYRIIN
jgi:hypothetical protein